MFDKNIFKEKFRLWSDMNPLATLEESERFCQQQIPIEVQNKYPWLIEESLNWFSWRQENLKREIMKEADEVMLKI